MHKDRIEKNKELPAKRRKKIALGRGLEALIPDIDSFSPDAKVYLECDIQTIYPNRYQPRKRFAAEELTQLSRSIKEQGIIQPLLVCKSDKGYELIAGERRLRAAKMAGLDRVPVVVKDVSAASLIEMSIVENIQRQDLNPLEEAEAYHSLMTTFGLTQDQTAKRVAKSRSTITNLLRLRQLPQPIKDSILEETLTEGHARALVGIKTPAQQRTVWKTILSKNLSVRETEALIKNLRSKAPQPKKTAPNTEQIYFTDLAAELSRQLGTKVKINKRGRSGKVEIEFYSNDDLDRLIDLLKRSV